MKIALCVILFFVLSVFTYSFDVKYSEDAEKKINVIAKDNKIFTEKFKTFRLMPQKIKFKDIRDKLRIKYPGMRSEKIEGIIEFSRKRPPKGAARVRDREKFKSAALDFVKKEIPNILTNDEHLGILYVAEDYGADQEKDENGRIIPNVNIKSYSFSIKIARKFLGKPVFNSFSEIEIDSESNEIISFNLKNWVPFKSINKGKIDKIKAKEIKNVIKTRLQSEKIVPNIKIKSVEVTRVVNGWIIDESDSLIPAFIHYGYANAVDEKTGKDFKDHPYAFLEKMIDPTSIRKPSKSEDEYIYRPSPDSHTEKKPEPQVKKKKRVEE